MATIAAQAAQRQPGAHRDRARKYHRRDLRPQEQLVLSLSFRCDGRRGGLVTVPPCCAMYSHSAFHKSRWRSLTFAAVGTFESCGLLIAPSRWPDGDRSPSQHLLRLNAAKANGQYTGG